MLKSKFSLSLFAALSFSLFLGSASPVFADGGSIIPGSCPLNGNDVNEVLYSNGNGFEITLNDIASDSSLDILNNEYQFSAASRAHTLRRHWNGIAFPGESTPTIFNRNYFPGFFVVESLIYETVNNAIALGIAPCSTREVNGQTYAAYTVQLTAGVIARVILNVANHVIVTAYPVI